MQAKILQLKSAHSPDSTLLYCFEVALNFLWIQTVRNHLGSSIKDKVYKRLFNVRKKNRDQISVNHDSLCESGQLILWALESLKMRFYCIAVWALAQFLMTWHFTRRQAPTEDTVPTEGSGSRMMGSSLICLTNLVSTCPLNNLAFSQNSECAAQLPRKQPSTWLYWHGGNWIMIMGEQD